VSTKDRGRMRAGRAFSDYSGTLCKGFRQLITPVTAAMHAGTEGGGGGGVDEEQPDPDPRNDGEEQCDEEVGADGAAASMSVDVRSDEAAADGKPPARASASAAASAKGSGSGNAVKRKKPKPKHQRSQKPEGYPSRNRYVNPALCIGRPARRLDQLIACSFFPPPFAGARTTTSSKVSWVFIGGLMCVNL
jgi:hypothetical protein